VRVGLFAGNSGAFLETLETGNALSGHHLSVRSPSVCSQACPVKYYGLECWGWAIVGSERPPELPQRQSKFTFLNNKIVKLIAKNTPSCWHREGGFWKSTYWQIFPPCPPGHLPPQTDCAGVLRYV
jgi:hypothetical protein